MEIILGNYYEFFSELFSKYICTQALVRLLRAFSISTFLCDLGPSPESRELSLRLTGGQDERRGRLEMMRNGEWGFVCGENFSLLNARVACRQMGFDE